MGKVNATLPKGTDPLNLTMEEAVALIAAKSGKAAPARSAKAKPDAKAKPAAKAKSAAKAKPVAKTAAGKGK